MTMGVKEILRAYDHPKGTTAMRLHYDPNMYSGRGNNPSDLNSEMLKAIRHTIETNISPLAARAFTTAVDWMQKTGDISATTFLNNLYKLEAMTWNPAASDADIPAPTRGSVEGEGLYRMAFGRSGFPAHFVTDDFLKEYGHEVIAEPVSPGPQGQGTPAQTRRPARLTARRG